MVSGLGKIVYSTAAISHPTAIEAAFKKGFLSQTRNAAKIVDKDMVASEKKFTSVLDFLVKGFGNTVKKIERQKGEHGIGEKMTRVINNIFKSQDKAAKVFEKFLAGNGVTELIDDGFGSRIMVNSKTFINKKGQEVNTIDEIFKRILNLQKKGKATLEEVESYHGKGFAGYISEDLKNTLALEGTNVISKTKDAGYTRVNMILNIEGKRIELQIGGSDMLGNKEHIFHNIRENKKINFSKYTAEEKKTAKELEKRYKGILRTDEGKKVYESYLNSCWKHDKACFDQSVPMEINAMPKIKEAFKNYLKENPTLRNAYKQYLTDIKNGSPANHNFVSQEGDKIVTYNLKNLHFARKQMHSCLDARVFTSLPG